MTARFHLRPDTPPLTVDDGVMYGCGNGVDLSRSVVLPEEMYEPPDEVDVQARLLLLFHLPRGEFRGFVEVRLVDVQVVKP
jgi:hypothetical protein